MTIQQFIQAAIEGGWVNNFINPKSPAEMMYLLAEHKYKMFLDPEAWKAVGKVKGWVEDEYLCSFGADRQNLQLAAMYRGTAYIVGTWQMYFSGMSNALIQGKTLEEYIATL